jgi:hypothetical protein
MTFSGKPGTALSRPGNMVPGFGTTSIHYGKTFTASMTPTGSVSPQHYFVFPQTSISLYRVVNRVKNYVSILRTKE